VCLPCYTLLANVLVSDFYFREQSHCQIAQAYIVTAGKYAKTNFTKLSDYCRERL